MESRHGYSTQRILYDAVVYCSTLPIMVKCYLSLTVKTACIYGLEGPAIEIFSLIFFLNTKRVLLDLPVENIYCSYPGTRTPVLALI